MEEATLYVLAAPMPGTRTPAYLMHEVGGVDCVLGYTDLEHLVECCGEHQPWLGVRIDALMADLRDQRLPGPVVNLPLAPQARWTADGPPWDAPRLASADTATAAATATAAETVTYSEAAASAAGTGRSAAADPVTVVEVETVEVEVEAVAGAAEPAGAGATAPGTRPEWWR
jgi:hypothetical protein